jgi:hypothetical protein
MIKKALSKDVAFHLLVRPAMARSGNCNLLGVLGALLLRAFGKELTEAFGIGAFEEEE